MKRNIPLSNKNTIPGDQDRDPYPEGHTIRRDGSSANLEDVFITDQNNPADPADLAASRNSATFPADQKARLKIPPGTLGYPDGDTYRDLYFIIETVKK